MGAFGFLLVSGRVRTQDVIVRSLFVLVDEDASSLIICV